MGKSLYVEHEKIWIRGVTYGTFRPGDDGTGYEMARARRDFAAIAANDFNAIRTYTVPPRWLLDLAREFGLWVMVGVSWEQHVAFLDDKRLQRSVRDTVRQGARNCSGHPAVLCYAIGNEVPTSVVRWHGHEPVERFLRQLFEITKTEDPDGLVTYVNYPSTEYLELPFLDLVCCNVYLEAQERLQAYLARLQNLAADCPLLLGEVGLDSRRNGEDKQAQVLSWQIQTALGAGCAGAFVFAWTDEWHRDGHEIEDWDFGIAHRDRAPKPALAAIQRSFKDAPFPPRLDWPRISVVVCSYNGGATIGNCCEGLAQVEYPDFEVIVVNDGSTDDTESIVRRYEFRIIKTENLGLSSARNTGLEAASGEIVAYVDDDARPDPHWLQYLAIAFLETGHVGIGGPNIAPAGDGNVAECVANAPGGPVHVLISDTEAEHIPGCNMAFRKSALQAIGGFDPQFHAAGDDVDICWRLQKAGGTLGFSPGASVLHHRRNSVLSYWKQQKGYGKAEALLERKWPEKYNGFGHLTWAGRLYGKGLAHSKYWARYLLRGHSRIYSGTWGSAPFQSRDEVEPGTLGHLLLMPECFIVLAMLAGFSLVGALWRPLLVAVPVLAVSLLGVLAHAALHGVHAVFRGPRRGTIEQLKLRALIAYLHLIQPVARLLGRLRHGLTPWRRHGEAGFLAPVRRSASYWSEQWKSAEARLHSIEEHVQEAGLSVARGGAYDRWDLEVKAGLLGGALALFSIEEHGAGRQLCRLRTWPSIAVPCLVFGLLLLGLSAAAGIDGSALAAAILAGSGVILFGRLFWECGISSAALDQALERHENRAEKAIYRNRIRPVEAGIRVAEAATARGNRPSTSEGAGTKSPRW